MKVCLYAALLILVPLAYPVTHCDGNAREFIAAIVEVGVHNKSMCRRAVEDFGALEYPVRA